MESGKWRSAVYTENLPVNTETLPVNLVQVLNLIKENPIYPISKLLIK